MIENSSYISLQEYVNNSNIIESNKYRPSIKTLCNISVCADFDMQEVPLRYLYMYNNRNYSSNYIKKGTGENINNYYRIDKKYVYTKYDLNINFIGKDSLKKRYADISIYKQYCIDIDNNLQIVSSNYIDVVYKAMNRFNYIMDNSCYIINSGYGKNIFDASIKTKLGKLFLCVSSYYIGDGDVFDFMNESLKFDKTKVTDDNINKAAIKLHYEKKIENKTLYWVPIIRTVSTVKSPMNVSKKFTSNRLSYRFKHMPYNDGKTRKLVNADVFNSFNDKQFYFPLRTFKYYKRGDNNADLKTMIQNASITFVKPIENAEPFSASLDLLEMIYGKSNINENFVNNLVFYPIYDIPNTKSKMYGPLHNTFRFHDRCQRGLTNRKLIRFRTSDSSLILNIIIPSSKYKKLFRWVKIPRDNANAYNIRFDVGIAIIDKNGRHYKVKNNIHNASLQFINYDNYIIPNNIPLGDNDKINLDGLLTSFSFINADSLVVKHDTTFYNWGAINNTQYLSIEDISYYGTNSSMLCMSNDRIALLTNGLATLPTVELVEELVLLYEDTNISISLESSGNIYAVYINKDNRKYLLFKTNDSNGVVDFWTKTRADEYSAYTLLFNLSNMSIKINQKSIVENESVARLLPIIQEKTCVVKNYIPETPIDVDEISIIPSEITLFKGLSATLTPIIKPDDATNKNIIWSVEPDPISSNISISMNNGKITCINPNDEYYANVSVYVKSALNLDVSAYCTINVDSYSNYFIDMGYAGVWAKYNLGINPTKLDNTPTSWYGNRYAWGELSPKQRYVEENYALCEKNPLWNDYDYKVHRNNDTSTLIHGNVAKLLNSYYIHNIDSIDDAASYLITSKGYKNYNIDYFYAYQIPSNEDFEDLIYYTNREYITGYNGVEGLNGILFIPKPEALAEQNASIFIPYTNKENIGCTNKIEYTLLWKNSIFTKNINNRIGPTHALSLKCSTSSRFKNITIVNSSMHRYEGLYVRPVRRSYIVSMGDGGIHM